MKSGERDISITGHEKLHSLCHIISVEGDTVLFVYGPIDVKGVFDQQYL